MCLSVLVALLMIVPGFRLLGPKVDLAREYQRQVLRLLAHILVWFAIWFLGIMSGIWSLLH